MSLKDDNKKHFVIGLIIGATITLILMTLSPSYSSEAECKVKELQKGAATDSYYRNTVRTYCREQYGD